ncbi:MoeB/ThiF family adenylyltransferase [Pseudalkalibacillus salsuginis]|uniref:MoeB/ThiF family adenylyltransferase n=1 Tax=Pseudalkalibacillus salsuginis TaxID=2910972 RepID=UPI001EEE1B55|nr:MoeB/ThiF family adenylyltransferase [Pseudalkalibacillus salsuginis]MCF6408907.1 ThiF family adenylyltransferase [Pseudalkalibacillus salsuginis]
MHERYSRQIRFTKIGSAGQGMIRRKHVLLIGAGALGTSCAEMLVRAGIGKLTIIDRDYVEWSNLQRQQLYTETDAEDQLPKAVAAKARLSDLNREVKIDARIEETNTMTIEEQIQDADLIIDATDNFETRMLINDAAQKWKIPWIYGACTGSHGLTYTILPGDTPCLACLLGKIPSGSETCDTVGIISPAVQMVTAYQVAESFKILVEDFQAIRKQVIYFDLWNNQHTSLKVDNLKNPQCDSCCPEAAFPYLNHESSTKTAVLCGRDTVQIRPMPGMAIDMDALKQKLSQLTSNIRSNDYLLQVEIDDTRMVVFKDNRVLIHGTKDINKAKTLYNRYITG